MALDEGGGAAAPTKKKKPQQPIFGPSEAATQALRQNYQGASSPAFQRIGFQGDIHAFNRRIQLATDSFERRFGYQPSPGLALDVARAPVGDHEIPDLFRVPVNFQRAQARGANYIPTAPPRTENSEPLSFVDAVSPFGNYPDPVDDTRRAVADIIEGRKVRAKVKRAEVSDDVVYPVSFAGTENGLSKGELLKARRGYLEKAGSFAVDSQALQIMREVWKVVGPKYFPGQVMPVPIFTHENKQGRKMHAAAWVTLDPGREFKVVYWPKEITNRLASRDSISVSTLLHEWAHVFQKGDRMREGGATAFENRVLPVVVNEIGEKHGIFDVPLRFRESKEYLRFARKVEKTRGKDWVLWGQFGGEKTNPAGFFESLRAPTQLEDAVGRTHIGPAEVSDSRDRREGQTAAYQDALEKLKREGFVEEYSGQLEEEAQRLAAGQSKDILAERLRGDVAIQKMGIDLDPFSQYVIGPFLLGTHQVTESLVYSPAGLYEVGKALGFDTRDVVTGRDFTPGRTKKVGKAVVAGVKETYKHPLENPGFIFMDALGLVSAGGGAVGRASAARRAIERGASRGEVARSLVRRPEGGTFELGGENVILTENTAARVVQKAILEQRKQRLNKRRGEVPDSYAPLSRRARLRGQFATEAKVGREARARQRVEHAIAMSLKRDLDHAAGWAINSSRALSHMPNALRRGLTRGEQKAIQVLATDEPGGWEAQLALHERFHRRMLDQNVGDPLAHQRQLADLQLARQALENPRGRVLDAYKLTYQVMAEQELLKVQRLGLNPETAKARIAEYAEVLRRAEPNIKDDLRKAFNEGLVNGVTKGAGAAPLRATKQIPESFYLPSTLRSKSRKPVSTRVPTVRPGQFGVPAPRQLPELTHVFTGESIRWGDTRIDTTHLAGEAYARTVRLAAVMDEHKRLLREATDQKRSEWDIPIRESQDIPDELRTVVNQFEEGAVSKKDIDGLSPNFQEALYSHLFPKTNVEGVKWVDSRLIGDAFRYPNQPGFAATLASGINEVPRALILFARPAYSLNLLGNAAMLLIQQGPFAVKNVGKALRANKIYGENVTRTMEALIGEGKALSFAPDDLVTTKISRTMAHAWNALVDRKMRLAAFIYEAERKGYKTGEDMQRLLDMKTTDKKLRADRVEISRRGNKAVVEFDNMTPFEKMHLRHWIFVYPWVSRSIVWSLRTMVEHPLKTWTLTQLGKVGEEVVGEEFGDDLPDWFRQTGYFPVAMDDEGKPLVVNPTSINTFASLSEAYLQARNLVERQKDVSGEELLGPLAEFGLRALTGRDQFGREYESGAVQGAFSDFARGLPQVAAAKRAEKSKPGAAALERPTFTPGEWGDVYGPLIAGGLWPRTADTEALRARWLRDHPEEKAKVNAQERNQEIMARLAIERKAVWQAEQFTAKNIIGRSIPEPVKDALRLRLLFAEAYGQRATGVGPYGRSQSIKTTDAPQQPGLGRSLTGVEKYETQIEVLRGLGRITPEQADELYKTLNSTAGKYDPKKGSDLSSWGSDFAKKYLNDEALADWWDERDQIIEVADNLPRTLTYLRNKGMYDGHVGDVSQEDRWQVGREYVKFAREAIARSEESAPRSDLETLDNSADRWWMDQQDRLVRVNGVKYPSPVRIGWALKSPDEKLNNIAEWSTASWETLSDFEKEIVGRKPKGDASYGWVILNAVMDGYRGNISAADELTNLDIKAVDGSKGKLSEILPQPLATGERDIERKHKIALAKWVDKVFAPGFYKDFLFSQEPKYRRISVLPIVTRSKAKSEWNELLNTANVQYGYIKYAREQREAGNYKVGYTITGVQDQWDDYAKNTLYPYYEKSGSDTFKKELELLGGVDFLRTLIAD